MSTPAQLDSLAVATLTSTLAGYNDARDTLVAEHLGPEVSDNQGVQFLDAFIRLVAALRGTLAQLGIDAGVSAGPGRAEVVAIADARLRGDVEAVAAALRACLGARSGRSRAVAMVEVAVAMSLELVARLGRVQGISPEEYLGRLGLWAATD